MWASMNLFVYSFASSLIVSPFSFSVFFFFSGSDATTQRMFNSPVRVTSFFFFLFTSSLSLFFFLQDSGTIISALLLHPPLPFPSLSLPSLDSFEMRADATFQTPAHLIFSFSFFFLSISTIGSSCLESFAHRPRILYFISHFPRLVDWPL